MTHGIFDGDGFQFLADFKQLPLEDTLSDEGLAFELGESVLDGFFEAPLAMEVDQKQSRLAVAIDLVVGFFGHEVDLIAGPHVSSSQSAY